MIFFLLLMEFFGPCLWLFSSVLVRVPCYRSIQRENIECQLLVCLKFWEDFFALNFARVDLNRHLGMTVLLSSFKFWRNLKINELKLVLNILSF